MCHRVSLNLNDLSIASHSRPLITYLASENFCLRHCLLRFKKYFRTTHFPPRLWRADVCGECVKHSRWDKFCLAAAERGWARLAGLSLKNGLITTGWRVILIVYCLLKPGILQISPQHHVLIRGKSASTWTYFTVSESRSVNKIIIEIEKMCLNVRSWRSRHSICCA